MLYICNVWSMKCFPDNFEEKILNKNTAYKIYLSHLNASMAIEEMKRNVVKCYIMCSFQDVKPTQETAGSGLNRLYNVLC